MLEQHGSCRSAAKLLHTHAHTYTVTHGRTYIAARYYITLRLLASAG